MAQETKNAIRRAFIRLLNERPIDKISIKDIAETGAVNRNTFYYYYADIYALVEDIFEMEAADFLTKMRRYESWQEAFLDATDFAMQNKRAVFHLYNSANQGTLRRYYHKVILGAMMTYVQGQAEGLTVQEEDIRVLAEISGWRWSAKAAATRTPDKNKRKSPLGQTQWGFFMRPSTAFGSGHTRSRTAEFE